MTFLGAVGSAAPALIDGQTGETWSFADLHERAGRVAARLGATKSLVFLACRNDRFSALAYAGALTGGHAVALIDGQGPETTIASLVQAYRPSWVAGPAGLADRLADQGVPIETVVTLEGGELAATGYPVPAAMHPDLAVLLATSGTTGSRKFVRLSRGNLESNARSIGSYLQLTPDERPATSLPMHYSFGLSVINSHWLAGAPIVMTAESVIQQRFWEIVRTQGCTSLAGVPYTFQMLERIGFRDMELPTLTTLQQAGGALDRVLTQVYDQHMAARGGRFFVMYGQTEATARIAYVPAGRLADKLGSAGVAIPGGRLRIDPLPDAAPGGPVTGEVVYEGPNVMLGYATGPDDLARGDDLGGVLRTGDIGYLDDEGFLFLVGRSKRIAKVFGLRVNLDEVETWLREHGPAAVVGGQDVILAFCAFGTDASVAELGDQFARRTRLHRSALRFQRVDAIPTTGSGKIDYEQVQAWAKLSIS